VYKRQTLPSALSEDGDFFNDLQTLDADLDELEDDLEEALLYMKLKRFTEAKSLLDELIERHGRHTLLLDAYRQLQGHLRAHMG